MIAIEYFQRNRTIFTHHCIFHLPIIHIVTMPQFNVNNLNFLNWDYPAIYEVIMGTLEYSDIGPFILPLIVCEADL